MDARLASLLDAQNLAYMPGQLACAWLACCWGQAWPARRRRAPRAAWRSRPTAKPRRSPSLRLSVLPTSASRKARPGSCQHSVVGKTRVLRELSGNDKHGRLTLAALQSLLHVEATPKVSAPGSLSHPIRSHFKFLTLFLEPNFSPWTAKAYSLLACSSPMTWSKRPEKTACACQNQTRCVRQRQSAATGERHSPPPTLPADSVARLDSSVNIAVRAALRLLFLNCSLALAHRRHVAAVDDRGRRGAVERAGGGRDDVVRLPPLIPVELLRRPVGNRKLAIKQRVIVMVDPALRDNCACCRLVVPRDVGGTRWRPWR